jgi:hypothetical protein
MSHAYAIAVECSGALSVVSFHANRFKPKLFLLPQPLPPKRRLVKLFSLCIGTVKCTSHATFGAVCLYSMKTRLGLRCSSA